MKQLSIHITEAFVNESKTMTAAQFVKKIKEDTENWGDLGDVIRIVKGNLEVAGSYFYGGKIAMSNHIKAWSPGGEYYEYFKNDPDFGIEFEIIDSFSELKASGSWYKKNVGTDGIVSITLKIK